MTKINSARRYQLPDGSMVSRREFDRIKPRHQVQIWQRIEWVNIGWPYDCDAFAVSHMRDLEYQRGYCARVVTV